MFTVLNPGMKASRTSVARDMCVLDEKNHKTRTPTQKIKPGCIQTERGNGIIKMWIFTGVVRSSTRLSKMHAGTVRPIKQTS